MWVVFYILEQEQADPELLIFGSTNFAKSLISQLNV